MPISGSVIHPERGCIQNVSLTSGDLWLQEERGLDSEVQRIIAVYCPYDDYGAEVHALDPDVINVSEITDVQDVPEDLINDNTQIGYVFANTYFTLPAKIAPECGRLLLAHMLHPRYLN